MSFEGQNVTPANTMCNDPMGPNDIYNWPPLGPQNPAPAPAPAPNPYYPDYSAIVNWPYVPTPHRLFTELNDHFTDYPDVPVRCWVHGFAVSGVIADVNEDAIILDARNDNAGIQVLRLHSIDRIQFMGPSHWLEKLNAKTQK